LPRPEDRVAEVEKMRARVRRNHKVNTRKKRQTFQPGQEAQLKQIALVLKVAGYSNKQIGASIGVTRGIVGEWLNDPKTQQQYLELLEAIPAAAKELLQTYSIEAVHTIAEVMRTSNDDKMILEAAKDILDRSGLPKASRSEVQKDETHTSKTEFGVNPDDMDALRSLSPELQEEAAQAIEGLEKFLSGLVEKNEGGNGSS
jgi:hypothetical protein